MTAPLLIPISDAIAELERRADEAAWRGQPFEHLDQQSDRLRQRRRDGEEYEVLF